MFSDMIFRLKRDMSKHHRSKEELTNYYVQTRLTKSLTAYYKEVSNSVQYLVNRNPETVIRKL